MMKRFKFLSTLIIGLIGLVSFGYCTNLPTNNWPGNGYGPDYNYTFVSDQIPNVSNGTIVEYYVTNPDVLYTCIRDDKGQMYEYSIDGVNFDSITSFYGIRCTEYKHFRVKKRQSTSSILIFTYYLTTDPLVQLYKMPSSECESMYSLMPISSCNSEYCSANGYCPEDGGDDSLLSELYINGINHVSKPVINITIPEEINRSYTNTGNSFDLVISGSNVDYEYMDNIIRTQHSTPNSTDFNNTISGLIPLFVPGLVIILFIIFVFRFLKKIF